MRGWLLRGLGFAGAASSRYVGGLGDDAGGVDAAEAPAQAVPQAPAQASAQAVPQAPAQAPAPTAAQAAALAAAQVIIEEL